MEEDPSSSRRTPLSSFSSFSSFSSSEEQPLSEEMEVEVSKEIAKWQQFIPSINRKLPRIDDNLDVLLEEAEQLGFSGVPLPHVLLDNKKLREHAIGQVRKRKREKKSDKENKKEEKENKSNRENSIKRNKAQETIVPRTQDNTTVSTQKALLEKN
ncbi:MAG: hypothetical protein BGO67_08830 [Alphaproteobacteria bacterium 41-28]|nr:MAG: hypothetical protein BGO67_08830 [Alphaproteobacteria bacterium 41-28]